MKKNNAIIISIIIAIIFAAGGFFAGMQYQKSQARSALAQGFGGAGGFRRFAGANGATGSAPIRGTVLSTDASSITLKLADGSSKVIILSSGTGIVKSTTAKASDVKSGDTVTIIGTSNSDGTVTAQQVLDGSMGMLRGPRPSGQPAQ